MPRLPKRGRSRARLYAIDRGRLPVQDRAAQHFPARPGGGAPRETTRRMGQDKIDTQFLKDTVADVLVRACSECAVSQPKDPVGFVAGWLDQYVANDTILKKHEAAKQLAAEQAAAIEQVSDPLPV